MSIRTYGTLAGTAMLMAWVGAAPAHALTIRECATKYEAAKAAGALGGMKWNDFRKAECGPGASPAATTAPNPGAGSAAGRYYAPPSAFGGRAVFPTAISRQYTNLSAGKARMRTCLDQYRANKTSGANGGLKWIQKGGGYYSECSKRLGGR